MFDKLAALAPDPILGLSAAYQADTNANKVDLGVGIYKDDAGNTPIMSAVSKAEAIRFKNETTKVYTAPAGYAGANEAVTALAYGADHAAIKDKRVKTIQSPGGCGALRVAAETIKRAKADACIWVSTPTWANHVPLLGNAGLKLKEYPYYNYQTHQIDFERMLDALKAVPAGDLVLLHACCHNPSGADLTKEQWDAVTELAHKQGFTPFIDMAYQGFGVGLDADAYGLRVMAEKLPELVLASSYSKNFGLYRERAGALSIVSANETNANAVLTQMLAVARGIYSMPPAHGSAIVDIVLHSDELNKEWQLELSQMRQRIQSLRELLVEHLHKAQDVTKFDFIAREKGMFSFLGLSEAQVLRLRNEYSIYMTSNSRINVAGLTAAKMEYVAKAIANVL